MASLSERERDQIDWPALEAAHALEPELRAPAPRRVVLRAPRPKLLARAKGCAGQSCLGCALSAMFALGLFLCLWAGLALLILPFGSTTTGTITAHELTRGAPEMDALHFKFRPPGAARAYQGQGTVRGETFLELRDGDPAKVRYFAWAPGLRPSLEAGVSPWLSVLFLGPLGLLMLVVGGLPLLGLLPPPGQKLVRRGVPVAAVVVASEGNNAVFCFRASNAFGDKRVFEVSQHLASDSTPLVVGAVVTALFAPRNPKRALIYSHCAYRAGA